VKLAAVNRSGTPVDWGLLGSCALRFSFFPSRVRPAPDGWRFLSFTVPLFFSCLLAHEAPSSVSTTFPDVTLGSREQFSLFGPASVSRDMIGAWICSPFVPTSVLLLTPALAVSPEPPL